MSLSSSPVKGHWGIPKTVSVVARTEVEKNCWTSRECRIWSQLSALGPVSWETRIKLPGAPRGRSGIVGPSWARFHRERKATTNKTQKGPPVTQDPTHALSYNSVTISTRVSPFGFNVWEQAVSKCFIQWVEKIRMKIWRVLRRSCWFYALTAPTHVVCTHFPRLKLQDATQCVNPAYQNSHSQNSFSKLNTQWMGKLK